MKGKRSAQQKSLSGACRRARLWGLQSHNQGAFFPPRQVPQALHQIKVPALPQISKRVERNTCLGFSGAGAVPKTPKPQRLQSPAAHPLPSPHGLTRTASLMWEDRLRLPPRLVSRCPPFLPVLPRGWALHRPPLPPAPSHPRGLHPQTHGESEPDLQGLDGVEVAGQLPGDTRGVEGQAPPHVRQILLTLVFEPLNFHHEVLAESGLHHDHVFENQAEEK